MSTAAIIAAKGASRRVPGKNMMDIGGRPLFAWSVIQAKCSHFVDRVYVTTDSQEIAGEATRLGAKVIWRSVLDQDVAACVVYGHAIDEAEKMDGPFDMIVSVLPTSPLRMPYDIDGLIRVYRSVMADPKASITGCIVTHDILVYRYTEKPRLETVYLDKLNRSVMAAGGLGGCSVALYKKYVEIVPGRDSVIDNKDLGLAGVLTHDYGYEMEWWQQFEIDVYDEVEIVDYYMRKKVLTVPDVYERYAECDIMSKYGGPL